MKKSVFAALWCMSVLLLGGCASGPLKGNEGKALGAAVGGVAAHALTGGASTAWHIFGTAVGAVGGAVAGSELVDKKDKK